MPQDCHRSQVMEPEAKVGLGNGGLGIERDTARKKLRAETDQEVLVSAFNNHRRQRRFLYRSSKQ